MINPIAKNVLDFWFGDWPLSPEQNAAQSSVWFSPDQDFDYDIERRFGKLVSTARQGSFDSWAHDPYSCLALILVLDQFPRNLYRGQAGAFASDDKALQLSRSMAETGALNELGYTERAFALMPYQHTEDLQLQQEGIEHYSAQAESAPEPWQKIMAGYLQFAHKHLDIIQQFGRFPHRNLALGRESTPEEQAYLNAGASRFGQ